MIKIPVSTTGISGKVASTTVIPAKVASPTVIPAKAGIQGLGLGQ